MAHAATVVAGRRRQDRSKESIAQLMAATLQGRGRWRGSATAGSARRDGPQALFCGVLGRSPRGGGRAPKRRTQHWSQRRPSRCTCHGASGRGSCCKCCMRAVARGSLASGLRRLLLGAWLASARMRDGEAPGCLFRCRAREASDSPRSVSGRLSAGSWPIARHGLRIARSHPIERSSAGRAASPQRRAPPQLDASGARDGHSLRTARLHGSSPSEPAPATDDIAAASNLLRARPTEKKLGGDRQPLACRQSSIA